MSVSVSKVERRVFYDLKVTRVTPAFRDLHAFLLWPNPIWSHTGEGLLGNTVLAPVDGTPPLVGGDLFSSSVLLM